MFELIFKYKDQEVLNSKLFENQDEMYAFIKKEDIVIEKVIDKSSS